MAKKEDVKLPTLTITYQDLVERSKLLLSETQSTHGGELRSTTVSDTSNKTKPEKDKVHAGGLLYISPTKDPPKVGDGGENRVRRSTQNQTSSSQRRLFPTSTQEDTTSRKHKTTQNHEKPSPAKKNGRTSERTTKSGSFQKGPDIASPYQQSDGGKVGRTDGDNPRRENRKSERMSREAETKKPGRAKTERSRQTNTEEVTSDESPHDVLRKEWSRHEARKVERALSKWSGDLTKLKPVIQTW